ncbi:MAG: SRPBCC family protein [Candidatus Hodarchaeales archaeon]
MVEIRTEIAINSSAERVWNELMDFDKFPDWNPFIKEIKIINESFEVGSKIKANIDGIMVKPKVTSLIPNKEFHWLGSLLLPRIFDGRHMFEIEEITDNQIKFVHKEKFRGVLVWPLLKLIGKKTEKGFQNMNQALKERVEAS